MCRVTYRFFFFQAEDGIRDLVRSRGLGDVYKRQQHDVEGDADREGDEDAGEEPRQPVGEQPFAPSLALSLIHI